MDYPLKFRKALRVFFAVAAGVFFQKRALNFFEIKTSRTDKSGKRKRRATKNDSDRLINSSSTSVSNPNIRKHMAGKSTEFLWIIQCGGGAGQV